MEHIEENEVWSKEDLSYTPWFGSGAVGHDFGNIIFGDYQVVNPEPTLLDAGLCFAKEMVEKLLPAFPFIETFAIFWVEEEDDDCVGYYTNGTNTAPVFRLTHNVLLSYMFDHGSVAMFEEVALTLAHEFAHAVQECSGDEDMDEDEAEAFARAFVHDGKIIPVAGNNPVQ